MQKKTASRTTDTQCLPNSLQPIFIFESQIIFPLKCLFVEEMVGLNEKLWTWDTQ